MPQSMMAQGMGVGPVSPEHWLGPARGSQQDNNKQLQRILLSHPPLGNQSELEQGELIAQLKALLQDPAYQLK